ncbi:MAG: PKD domain-containing protein [Cyclobacteriaceae bacterium]|nr:PKD domain-containing protein [Cytophagales bacterium]MCZ8326792.1 PKD domain-containing protein [Cyclobacteriaceae bacterium]
MNKFVKHIRLIIAFAALVMATGCIEDADDLPKVEAGFTYTVSETGTVTFINTSNLATKYLWDFGDDETSTEVNPVKSYTPGEYIVNLRASNVAGAFDVFTDTLNIVVKDKVSLPITWDNTNVDYEVTTFNGASFAIVNNPSVSGTNNKETKVGAITNIGAAFEGIFIDLETQIDLATNKTIAMNVRSTVAVPILVKLEEGTSGPVEVSVNHGGTGWENLKFNFTSSAKYSRITMFVDGPGTAAGTFFVDDIVQEATVAPTAPTTAAPTPPARAAGDVVSLFSGAYTNVTVDTWRTGWSAGTLEDVNIAGNPTKKYSGLDFVGVETFNPKVNVANMTHVHIDVWSADFNQFSLKLVNFGATTTEHQVDYANPAKGEWISYDIPLTAFTGLAARNELAQYIFVGRPIGNNTIFIDNFYFYRNPVVTAPNTAAPTPPARAAGDVISIFSGSYTNLSGIDYNPNWGQSGFGSVNTAFNPGNGNLVLAYPNFNYQGTQLPSNVDASAMQFLHVDIWVAAGTDRQVKVSPINAGTGAAEFLVNVPLTPGQWNSVDLPKSSFTGMTWNAINQLKFDGQFNGNGTANTTPFNIYLDNIYFYKAAAGGGGGSTSFITNGGFELGDNNWLLFNNGGTTSINSTENNGGTKSAKIESGKFDNPGVKQERFAVGTVLPNTQYEVKFDVKQQTLVDGAVVNAFVFSETNTTNPAVQHSLTPITLSQGNWSSNTLTFTTAADVTGGISLLIEVVCGGADSCNGVVFIDNVSLVKK